MQKIFNGERITVRKLKKEDLKNVKEFLVFINSLVAEEAKVLVNKKLSLAEERKWLEEKIKTAASRKEFFLVALHGKKLVGSAQVATRRWRENHVGEFGISIKKEYRGIGLGKFLMSEIIKRAKKELSPVPKIIRSSVYSNNKPAICLYKKLGFKKVAEIPEQIFYKGKLINEIIMLRRA